jgi:hypothetical protein
LKEHVFYKDQFVFSLIAPDRYSNGGPTLRLAAGLALSYALPTPDVKKDKKTNLKCHLVRKPDCSSAQHRQVNV